jgi:hypothetical protein
VLISGAQGSNSFFINGVFKPTNEKGPDGRVLYVKRGDRSQCIEHHGGTWQHKNVETKGTDSCSACVAGGCALEECTSRVWKVLDQKKGLHDAADVKLRPSQAYRAKKNAMVRMPCALGAASALVVCGRCSVPARVMQHHALLGAMLSQRLLARVALQDKRFLGSEQLQLLCCGSPLSVLLIRLAAVVGRSGRSSAEHRYIVCTVKRYFSGVAHRLWPKHDDDDDFDDSGGDDNYDDDNDDE